MPGRAAGSCGQIPIILELFLPDLRARTFFPSRKRTRRGGNTNMSEALHPQDRSIEKKSLATYACFIPTFLAPIGRNDHNPDIGTRTVIQSVRGLCGFPQAMSESARARFSSLARDSDSCARFKPGDDVRVKSTFKAEVQSFLYFIPRKAGTGIRLTKGAVLRVADVIRGSGGCVLELANIFDGYVGRRVGEGVLIFCCGEDVESNLESFDRQMSTEEDQPPMILMGSASYQDIIATLDASEFPLDVAKQAASFLEVKNLEPREITASGSSSTRGDFPLSTTLANEDGTWWISAEGSMKNGMGEEWLEFRLSQDGSVRRCRFVGISIPPLPQGPLSVRRFRVDMSVDNGATWQKGGDDYVSEAMDLPGMQTFQLSAPIDANRVRLVCLQNADAAENYRPDGESSTFDCVGLFHVRWK